MFHALADATRRDIVRRVHRGEHSVSELARRYPMSFAAVQKHVAVLERAGLVTKRARAASSSCARASRRSREAQRLLDQLEGCGASGSTGSATSSPSRRPRESSMTVTGVHEGPRALTMTVTAEFDAPVERVWQLWADPRQLERWWGPPTYPATVVEHDLAPGGSGHLLHDRARGRRLTAGGGSLGRPAAHARVRGRLRRRRRSARTRPCRTVMRVAPRTERRRRAVMIESRSRRSRRWSSGRDGHGGGHQRARPDRRHPRGGQAAARARGVRRKRRSPARWRRSARGSRRS